MHYMILGAREATGIMRRFIHNPPPMVAQSLSPGLSYSSLYVGRVGVVSLADIMRSRQEFTSDYSHAAEMLKDAKHCFTL